MVIAWLHRLSRTGIDSTTPPRDVKFIVRVNSLVVAIFALGLVWIAIGCVLGQAPEVVVGFAQIVLFALPLWLNHRRWHRAAAVATQLLGNALLLACAFGFGLSSNSHLFLLAGTLFPFLALPPRARWLALGLSLLAGACFVVFPIVAADMPPLVVMPLMNILTIGNTIFCAFICALIGHQSSSTADDAEEALEVERANSERLLLNVLPAAIALRLKSGEGAIADGIAEATVLFSDIVGFTVLSQKLTPAQLVRLLDEVFSAFDALALRHGLEKIKTIGDAYMVAAGVPTPRNDHALRVARMAMDMRDVVANLPAARQYELSVRIGIHSGSVVAGVIGTSKFSYDLWGDTVNTASRMESHGAPGEVHVSAEVASAIAHAFELRPRGEIEVKGKGPMTTFFVGAAKPQLVSGR
ncbi:MAG: adenylate/guanylate cyclase domain-containing protein [Deltaproteobacteria bacterium]|nr:adenylate/guanylate cyclase domain-containing protein [Deltaproteobacteria bacterium]